MLVGSELLAAPAFRVVSEGPGAVAGRQESCDLSVVVSKFKFEQILILDEVQALLGRFSRAVNGRQPRFQRTLSISSTMYLCTSLSTGAKARRGVFAEAWRT